MSTLVKKGATRGVLQSPTMTGGTAWLVVSAAFENVSVRVRVWSDSRHAYGVDQIFNLLADQDPTRVGEWTALDVTKVTVEIVNPDGSPALDYAGGAVVDVALIPNRSF